MKKALFFVVAVMLLIVMVSMSNVGQVYGQQEPTLMWTIPPPEPIAYPEPYIEPYPAPIVEAVDVDNDDKVETVTRMYASVTTPTPTPTPTPTSVWIETEYCVKFVTHSICRR